MNYIESPPRTIMDVYKSLPEGTLAELINGSIVMSPSPTVNHQRVSFDIVLALGSYVVDQSLGEVFYSPLDVFFDEDSNVVQPDILFVSKNNRAIVKDSRIYGAPDLLIEILSPGNSNHDQITKKNLYERFGVKEYWIVDPDSKLARGFVLRNGKFDDIGSYAGEIKSVLLNKRFSF